MALRTRSTVSAEAPGRSHLDIGYEAAQRLVTSDGWPDGLMCVSDQIAYGAYRLARERNILIPERCMLVGIDGNPLNRWIAPWLRSIQVKYEDFGQPIVELLDHVWRGSSHARRIMPHCVA